MINMTIREARINQGMTQADLCKRAGISQTLLSKFENGLAKPSQKMLEIFAHILNLDPNEIIEGKPTDFLFHSNALTEPIIIEPEVQMPNRSSYLFAYAQSLCSNQTQVDINCAHIINRGLCELCCSPAPFCDSDGTPYLQKYYIRRPSLGGSETLDNTAFLCPNCFAKMTVLNRPEDVEEIRQNMKNRPKMQSDADE